MVKWEIDKEKSARVPEVISYISDQCEKLAKEIDDACPDHVLVCSGGPYRGADITVGYDVDKKKLKVDIYSYIRMDPDREQPAIDYAKGMMREACIHRGYLEKKYPNEWRDKYKEWQAGMWKLSGQEQMDYLRLLIGAKEPKTEHRNRMTVRYLEKNEVFGNEVTKRIIKATFPEYAGNQFKIRLAETFIPDSSWEGGSRTKWKLVTRDGKLLDPGLTFSSGPFNPKSAFQPQQIPKNSIIVTHTYFQGKDLGIEILIRPDEYDTFQLKPSGEITPEEKIVLKYTSSLKSSYGGIKEYRFYEASRKEGITREKWYSAIDTCISKGLLTKGKAITVKGRNALNEN